MRLIDADALAKFIDYGHLNNPNEKLYSENDIREMIDMMPTVDAVEVVRCRDCKYNYHNMIPSGEAEYGCTKCVELPITADFYCAWGER